VLTSRYGLKTGYQSARVRIWRSYGVKVVISVADITTRNGVAKLLSDANTLGPVGAIFNLAVVTIGFHLMIFNLFNYGFPSAEVLCH
jgi:fatty acid synthase